MIHRSPAVSIAVVAHQAPSLVRDGTPGTVWCRSAAEVAVLARSGALRAALVAEPSGMRPDLLAWLHTRCTVLVIDPGDRSSRWEALGAAVIPRLPLDEAELRTALDRAGDRPAPPPGATDQGGVLVAVIGAVGADGASAAAGVARALAATGPRSTGVVLADLTLDAVHRSLHGPDVDAAGLPELAAAARFGPPSAAQVDAALHVAGHGLLVLPGLRHHHDWVTVGETTARSVLDALRMRPELIIAHVDRDLEGEAETGSFDIEDRNALARAVVRSADLLVVAGHDHRDGRPGLLATVAAVSALSAAPERIVVLETGATGFPWGRGRPLAGSAPVLTLRRGARADVRLGRALRARLLDLGAVADAVREPEPQRIVPGTLGHWAHDIEGWITPSVPQQP